MKNNLFSIGSKIFGFAIIAVFACTMAVGMPGKEKSKSTKKCKPVPPAKPKVFTSDETELVYLLSNDGLIDEVKGFVVEKKQHTLYINGSQVSDKTASKYISALKSSDIRVEVYPFSERLKQHPDASFMQLVLPVMLSSPCVDTQPKKDGC